MDMAGIGESYHRQCTRRSAERATQVSTFHIDAPIERRYASTRYHPLPYAVPFVLWMRHHPTDSSHHGHQRRLRNFVEDDGPGHARLRRL